MFSFMSTSPQKEKKNRHWFLRKISNLAACFLSKLKSRTDLPHEKGNGTRVDEGLFTLDHFNELYHSRLIICITVILTQAQIIT